VKRQRELTEQEDCEMLIANTPVERPEFFNEIFIFSFLKGVS
jgi:hypothetical protein